MHAISEPRCMHTKEVGPLDVGLLELGLLEFGFPEGGPLKVGSPEVGLLQVGSPEVGFLEVGLFAFLPLRPESVPCWQLVSKRRAGLLGYHPHRAKQCSGNAELAKSKEDTHDALLLPHPKTRRL